MLYKAAVLKNSVLDFSIDFHFPLALFNSFVPVTFIIATIDPIHFAEPMSLVVKEHTSICVTSFPNILAKSTFFVILILSFVDISIFFCKSSFAVSQTIDELAFVVVPVSPNVLAFPFWLSIYVFSNIMIAVLKSLLATPEFLKVLKLPFV